MMPVHGYDHGGGCACGKSAVCDCGVTGAVGSATFGNTVTYGYGGGGTFIVGTPEKKIPYKYAEDQIISDFKTYIDKTYGEHYKTENHIQAVDAWIALGDSTPTFRNTALKYLWRYGKKNGSNKADLMKTLHYVLMCLYVDHYKDGK
jgi:hypothetical protein